MSAENNMPVLAAATLKCSAMASNCARTMLGGHGSKRDILPGFCAVRHVIAVTPCTFKHAKVFKSA